MEGIIFRDDISNIENLLDQVRFHEPNEGGDQTPTPTPPSTPQLRGRVSNTPSSTPPGTPRMQGLMPTPFRTPPSSPEKSRGVMMHTRSPSCTPETQGVLMHTFTSHHTPPDSPQMTGLIHTHSPLRSLSFTSQTQDVLSQTRTHHTPPSSPQMTGVIHTRSPLRSLSFTPQTQDVLTQTRTHHTPPSSPQMTGVIHTRSPLRSLSFTPQTQDVLTQTRTHHTPPSSPQMTGVIHTRSPLRALPVAAQTQNVLMQTCTLSPPSITQNLTQNTFYTPPSRSQMTSVGVRHPQASLSTSTSVCQTQCGLSSSPQKPSGVVSGQSSFCTPPSTPQKPKKSETPETVRNLAKRLPQMNREGDLDATEKDVMAEALKEIGNAENSPEKRRLCERVANQLQPVETAKAHQDFASCINDGVQWPSHLGDKLNNLHGRPIVGIVDMEHITSPSSKGGYHFCPTQEGLLNIQINPTTGVFVAKFLGVGGKSKQSSFFPTEIATEEELFHKIRSAQLVASYENKRLCSMNVGGIQIFVIKFMQGALERSCFPLFFIGDLDREGPTINVAGLKTIQTADMITKLSDPTFATKLNKCIVFKHEGRLLLDLSCELEISGMEKAFYFWVLEATIGYRPPRALQPVRRRIDFGERKDANLS